MMVDPCRPCTFVAIAFYWDLAIVELNGFPPCARRTWCQVFCFLLFQKLFGWSDVPSSLVPVLWNYGTLTMDYGLWKSPFSIGNLTWNILKLWVFPMFFPPSLDRLGLAFSVDDDQGMENHGRGTLGGFPERQQKCWFSTATLVWAFFKLQEYSRTD